MSDANILFLSQFITQDIQRILKHLK